MNCADPMEHTRHGSCDGNVGDTVTRLTAEISKLRIENSALRAELDKRCC